MIPGGGSGGRVPLATPARNSRVGGAYLLRYRSTISTTRTCSRHLLAVLLVAGATLLASSRTRGTPFSGEDVHASSHPEALLYAPPRTLPPCATCGAKRIRASQRTPAYSLSSGSLMSMQSPYQYEKFRGRRADRVQGLLKSRYARRPTVMFVEEEGDDANAEVDENQNVAEGIRAKKGNISEIWDLIFNNNGNNNITETGGDDGGGEGGSGNCENAPFFGGSGLPKKDLFPGLAAMLFLNRSWDFFEDALEILESAPPLTVDMVKEDFENFRLNFTRGLGELDSALAILIQKMLLNGPNDAALYKEGLHLHDLIPEPIKNHLFEVASRIKEANQRFTPLISNARNRLSPYFDHIPPLPSIPSWTRLASPSSSEAPPDWLPLTTDSKLLNMAEARQAEEPRETVKLSDEAKIERADDARNKNYYSSLLHGLWPPNSDGPQPPAPSSTSIPSELGLPSPAMIPLSHATDSNGENNKNFEHQSNGRSPNPGWNNGYPSPRAPVGVTFPRVSTPFR